MTSNLAALTLHDSYTASDSVIIGKGSGLSFSLIGSFTLTFLSTPLSLTNVLHVLAMSKNLISVSTLCVDNPVNVLFFILSFKCRIRHTGVTLVCGQYKTREKSNFFKKKRQNRNLSLQYR